VGPFQCTRRIVACLIEQNQLRILDNDVVHRAKPSKSPSQANHLAQISPEQQAAIRTSIVPYFFIFRRIRFAINRT
jgi:hypothetical protein